MKTSKNIVIMGSTGSIGRQALEVISNNSSEFKAVGLSANKNIELVNEQAVDFNVSEVAVFDEVNAENLKNTNPSLNVLSGSKSLLRLACIDEADTILNSLVGSIGLETTLESLKCGKKLALANKESMVAGGEIIRKLGLMENIIPVDSEHSAIFQLLLGENINEVESLIITSSGGPFRDKSISEMEKATVETALKHPRWKMGPKITIDSATLMNKGLEVIEAHYLFNIPYKKIKVVIHPQSIIHSMVQFKDGSVKAHLGQTDMRIPILYAFSFPLRLDSPLPFLEWGKAITELNFEEVDYKKFPSLKLAYEAGKEGMTYPVVLNAANEIAVSSFLNGKIRLTAIPAIVEKVTEKHKPLDARELENVKEADRWGKEETKRAIGS